MESRSLRTLRRQRRLRRAGGARARSRRHERGDEPNRDDHEERDRSLRPDRGAEKRKCATHRDVGTPRRAGMEQHERGRQQCELKEVSRETARQRERKDGRERREAREERPRRIGEAPRRRRGDERRREERELLREPAAELARTDEALAKDRSPVCERRLVEVGHPGETWHDPIVTPSHLARDREITSVGRIHRTHAPEPRYEKQPGKDDQQRAATPAPPATNDLLPRSESLPDDFRADDAIVMRTARRLRRQCSERGVETGAISPFACRRRRRSRERDPRRRARAGRQLSRSARRLQRLRSVRRAR